MNWTASTPKIKPMYPTNGASAGRSKSQSNAYTTVITAPMNKP